MLFSKIALSIPGYGDIQPPSYIPSGGGAYGQKYIQWGVTVILIGITLLSLFYLLWGALDWIRSGGEKTKLQGARNKLIYAIVGLLVSFFSFFIVSFVGSIVGVNLFSTAIVIYDPPPVCTPPTTKAGELCPDGSGSFSCGYCTTDTGCPVCSHYENCKSGVYSIAICSGSKTCRTAADCGAPKCKPGEIGSVSCQTGTGRCVTHCETNRE